MTTTALGEHLGYSPFDALDFEAPYLIEKLLKERVVESEAEAVALFTEVKRYLVLNQIDSSRSWQMHSLRVDDVWHQFVLFTVEYTHFCRRYFGRYAHHAPSNAPDPGPRFGDPAPEATFEEFAARYAEAFGQPPSILWDDAASVSLHRRVVNDRVADCGVRTAGGRAELVGPDGRTLFTVNAIAADALRFALATGAFYVRELPGALTDAERVALARRLVHGRLLRVG